MLSYVFADEWVTCSLKRIFLYFLLFGQPTNQPTKSGSWFSRVSAGNNARNGRNDLKLDPPLSLTHSLHFAGQQNTPEAGSSKCNLNYASIWGRISHPGKVKKTNVKDNDARKGEKYLQLAQRRWPRFIGQWTNTSWVIPTESLPLATCIAPLFTIHCYFFIS